MTSFKINNLLLFTRILFSYYKLSMRTRLSSVVSMSRRLMTSRKEATPTLSSQRRSYDQSYNLSPILLFSKMTYVQKSYMSPFFQGNFAHFSSLRSETANPNLSKVDIISKEFIKPTVTTPQHLRTYEVSILDQVVPNVYMSFVYFFPNNHQNDGDLILERRHILKESLSKTLTKFYPLAGRIKDSRFIDCNDNGVYYVEAKMDDHLSDFLKHPHNKTIHQLLPLDPNSEELFSRKDLAMIQVTTFGCGGISIGLYTAHKIMDFYSITTFLKSWSATARVNSSEEINPSFILPIIAPSNPALPQDVSIAFFPLYSKNKNTTRRFLFRASSLATLKKKAGSSRVVAVTGLIWKCVIAASRAQTPKSSTLSFLVNLRGRTEAPTPPHTIGNLISLTPPIQCGENDDLGYSSIVQHMKNATNLYSSKEFVQKTFETWSCNAEAILNQLKMWYSDKNAKHMMVTSTCRSGIYETDFGWGNPLWVCVGNGDSDSQITENFVILMDTRCGNGIEAWVTLDEEDMMVFERDPELLDFASLDANPLELVE